MASCPGLAITIVNESLSEGEGSVDFPFEYLPLPESGDVVEAVNREGRVVCSGTVLSVKKPASYSGTAVVSLKVPLEYVDEVRSMKRLPRTSLKQEG